MARNRGNFPARKDKSWSAIPSIALAGFTGNATVSGASIAFTQASTIMRMLGEYVIAPLGGGTFAATDACTISIGIGVISSDAFALGATSFPDPGGEPEYPWLYWAMHFIYFGDLVGSANHAGVIVRKAFDVKSMRKVKPRQSLVFIAQYSDHSGTPPMELQVASTRVLLAE